MINLNLEIVKKNRKYFAALKDSKYKCKILIDENSKDLQLGEHSLMVDDISVRSQWGEDHIYKLSISSTKQAEAGVCTLKTKAYNSIMVKKAKELGGRFDRISKSWVFPDYLEDVVDELDAVYNSPLFTIEIRLLDDMKSCCGPVSLVGYTLCRARSRDGGAQVGDGVSLIEGEIYSGGSYNKWLSIASSGAVFRMQIPEALRDDVFRCAWAKITEL